MRNHLQATPELFPSRLLHFLLLLRQGKQILAPVINTFMQNLKELSCNADFGLIA